MTTQTETTIADRIDDFRKNEIKMGRMTGYQDDALFLIAKEIREANAKPDDVVTDARRYRRLQVLGCAPSNSLQLAYGTVLRFTNLDTFVDNDLRINPSRGERPVEDAVATDSIVQAVRALDVVEAEGRLPSKGPLDAAEWTAKRQDATAAVLRAARGIAGAARSAYRAGDVEVAYERTRAETKPLRDLLHNLRCAVTIKRCDEFSCRHDANVSDGYQCPACALYDFLVRR